MEGRNRSVICVIPSNVEDFKKDLSFNTISYDASCSWRIKSEPEYELFTWEDRHFYLADRWIRSKKTGFEYKIIGFKRDYANCIRTSEKSFDPDVLLKYYEFLNGEPCGKKVDVI